MSVGDRRSPGPPLGREDLFALFRELGLSPQTLEHPPVFRVGEGEEIKAALPGAHTKNLFLKDAKGRFWLVSAEAHARIDLKTLPAEIGSARLSFASADALYERLGVRPGSVTAFALINDPDREVGFVLDRALLEADAVNFHPLENSATTRLSREDFRAFLRGLGREPQVVAFNPSDCEGAGPGPS